MIKLAFISNFFALSPTFFRLNSLRLNAGLTEKTISAPGEIFFTNGLTASRIRRLALFLSTAFFENFRLAENPILGLVPSESFLSLNLSSKISFFAVPPCLITLKKAFFSFSLLRCDSILLDRKFFSSLPPPCF